MRAFLKYFSLPILLLGVCLSFCCYMAWKECKIQNLLVDESLQGNRYAVAILAKYEKPWKLDERIVNGAIQGNPYALEVLKIAQELNSK